ncbi:Trafficking protein particle complex subunit 5 [Habropoda laboriosa]|uniref:Trafficking protein particle complex subunit 5 n=1 Tax=Habropoda laboriosa TaxID=597456 RepID=A0A0L7RD14_9HYME|nr:Trafficking protein particle complex subunit 5 [Habropoda laboriosa]
MTSITISAIRTRTSILDKSLSKGKGEVSLSCFALLFSELVQYCQNRVYTVPELQNKLAEIGAEVGHRITDLLVVREKSGKREIKLLNILLFIKSTVWKSLFGREADKLEHANDDERTYYIIEKEALVNKFISVPKDKGSLNCASFIAGIVEAILCDCGFDAMLNTKVTAHWHKGTTYMVKFDDAVVTRDKQLEDR